MVEGSAVRVVVVVRPIVEGGGCDADVMDGNAPIHGQIQVTTASSRWLVRNSSRGDSGAGQTTAGQPTIYRALTDSTRLHA